MASLQLNYQFFANIFICKTVLYFKLSKRAERTQASKNRSRELIQTVSTICFHIIILLFCRIMITNKQNSKATLTNNNITDSLLINIYYPDEHLYYGSKYWLFLLNVSKYIFGFLFVVWRCFFFTLLSYTSTPVSRFYFIDLDPAAVLVPVAFFFYILSM